MAAMNQKTSLADSKWETRVKEYESRLKTAGKQVKRKQQGAKERATALETNIKPDFAVGLSMDSRYS
jgi:flagellar hook-basal body complex protein FliE